MVKPKKTNRKSPHMTFELKKIQAVELFLKEKIAFHKAARIKASVLYKQYEEFLNQCGFQDCKVEKYNLWNLIKQVLSPELASTLEKTHSKELYYVGLDLKVNSISSDQLLHLYELGISPFSGHMITIEPGDLQTQLYHNDLLDKDQVSHDERMVVAQPTIGEGQGEVKRHRGRPRKTVK